MGSYDFWGSGYDDGQDFAPGWPTTAFDGWGYPTYGSGNKRPYKPTSSQGWPSYGWYPQGNPFGGSDQPYRGSYYQSYNPYGNPSPQPYGGSYSGYYQNPGYGYGTNMYQNFGKQGGIQSRNTYGSPSNYNYY